MQSKQVYNSEQIYNMAEKLTEIHTEIKGERRKDIFSHIINKISK